MSQAAIDQAVKTLCECLHKILEVLERIEAQGKKK